MRGLLGESMVGVRTLLVSLGTLAAPLTSVVALTGTFVALLEAACRLRPCRFTSIGKFEVSPGRDPGNVV